MLLKPLDGGLVKLERLGQDDGRHGRVRPEHGVRHRVQPRVLAPERCSRHRPVIAGDGEHV